MSKNGTTRNGRVTVCRRPARTASPVVSFGTGIQAVDPATFGIPSTIQVANDRPALQTNINFLLGRVGSITQGFVQQGDTYGPGGTLFDFKADYHAGKLEGITASQANRPIELPNDYDQIRRRLDLAIPA